VSAAASGLDGFYGLIQRHIEIDPKEREARRRKRTGRAIWVSADSTTALLDTLPGLFIGIAASMLLLLQRVSRPHIARLARSGYAWPDVDRHDGLHPDRSSVVIREAGLFFANSDDVREQIERLRTPETRVVVLDPETSPFIDVTAAQMLAQLAARLRQDGIELRIARDIGQFRDVMHTAVPGDFRHSVFRTVDEALSDGTPRDGNTTQYGKPR